MAILTIDGKQYEAKVNFKFDRTANKKYTEEKDEFSGIEKIYQDLLGYKGIGLVAFWDCATAYLGKSQPSVEKIAEALEEQMESEEDAAEQAFKDAFKAMDNSGFLKLQLREFWKNLDLVDKMAKNEEEKEQALMAKEMFIKKREELNS